MKNTRLLIKAKTLEILGVQSFLVELVLAISFVSIFNNYVVYNMLTVAISVAIMINFTFVYLSGSDLDDIETYSNFNPLKDGSSGAMARVMYSVFVIALLGIIGAIHSLPRFISIMMSSF